MAKVSLSDLSARISTVDRARLDATTEAQIEAYREEDGFADLPVPEIARVVEPPRTLRVRLGLTQREMADALHVPLGTWRNWEQGRVGLEPAAAALLAIVSRLPGRALAALATEMSETPDVAVAPSAEPAAMPDRIVPKRKGASGSEAGPPGEAGAQRGSPGRKTSR